MAVLVWQQVDGRWRAMQVVRKWGPDYPDICCQTRLPAVGGRQSIISCSVARRRRPQGRWDTGDRAPVRYKVREDDVGVGITTTLVEAPVYSMAGWMVHARPGAPAAAGDSRQRGRPACKNDHHPRPMNLLAQRRRRARAEGRPASCIRARARSASRAGINTNSPGVYAAVGTN